MVYDLSAIYFAVAGFGTSSGATSVGCRLSRCPLLVEFALATLKMLLMGGNLTFLVPLISALDRVADTCNVIAGWSRLPLETAKRGANRVGWPWRG
jgi:hypothetical protein